MDPQVGYVVRGLEEEWRKLRGGYTARVGGGIGHRAGDVAGRTKGYSFATSP